jgi:hypothetical protein
MSYLVVVFTLVSKNGATSDPGGSKNAHRGPGGYGTLIEVQNDLEMLKIPSSQILSKTPSMCRARR